VRPYLQQAQQTKATHTFGDSGSTTTRKVVPWKNVTTTISLEEGVVEILDAANDMQVVSVSTKEEQTPAHQDNSNQVVAVVTIDATSGTGASAAIDQAHQQPTDASLPAQQSCPLSPSMDAAMHCLRQSTPDMANLTYPPNPLEHVARIHHLLQKWTNHSRPHCAAGYCGPWLENEWISKFTPHISDACLSETFGPYIPLLIPWTDLWVNSAGRGYHYPKGFIRKLQQLLRRPYLYGTCVSWRVSWFMRDLCSGKLRCVLIILSIFHIDTYTIILLHPTVTVSQNDWGIVGENEFPQWPNILVLSAGGYGHVPVPLLKQPEPLLVDKKVGRSNFVSYVGSLEHDPFQLRPHIHDYLQKRQNESTTSTPTPTFYKYHYGDDWRNIMWDSRYSLAPRGNGRTSYHLMEILQSGLVPIQVSQEVPWIPYASLYSGKWGYHTTLDDLPALVDSLLQMTDIELQEREAHIAAHRETHFTTAGVLEHIRLYLLNDDRSDLECTVLPNSTLLS
jgi:hypothetical protein